VSVDLERRFDLERRVVGGLVLAGASGPDAARRVATELRDLELEPRHFAHGPHRRFYTLAIDLVSAGDACDATTLADEVRDDEELAQIHSRGPLAFLQELLAETTTYSNTASHAKRLLAETDGATHSRFNLSRVIDGASFVASVPDQVPANWGEPGGGILWAQGEPLGLVGPDGIGKTTLAQQLALCRAGVRDHLLALPVKPAANRVLYIAADRPRQAASSLQRMVTPADQDLLRERLVIWPGPLPFDVGHEPRAFTEFVTDIGGISDVFIDSLKDIAVDLTKDETGSRVNVAVQELIASGREVVVSHHQRKQHNGGQKPKSLADVYGSRWIVAGWGSVVLLWGEPGDLVVELRHLKQPAEEVGPLQVKHDHSRGSSVVLEQADLETALANAQHGLTVKDAAGLMFETATPTANEVEKARRRLNRLVQRNRAERRDDPDGVARYHAPQKGA
jgi:replicative DNA helicase